MQAIKSAESAIYSAESGCKVRRIYGRDAIPIESDRTPQRGVLARRCKPQVGHVSTKASFAGNGSRGLSTAARPWDVAAADGR